MSCIRYTVSGDPGLCLWVNSYAHAFFVSVDQSWSWQLKHYYPSQFLDQFTQRPCIKSRNSLVFLTRINVLNVTCVFLYLHNLDYVHLVMEDVGETIRNSCTVMVTNISFRNYSCFSPSVYNFFFFKYMSANSEL